MPHVISSQNEEFKDVKVKFIPIASEYKGKPLDSSMTVEGRTYRASLQPGRWCTVPVFMAKNLKRMADKASRAMVPDGQYIERDMEQGSYNKEDGAIRSNVVEEYSPKFEIIIDGNVG